MALQRQRLVRSRKETYAQSQMQSETHEEEYQTAGEQKPTIGGGVAE